MDFQRENDNPQGQEYAVSRAPTDKRQSEKMIMPEPEKGDLLGQVRKELIQGIARIDASKPQEYSGNAVDSAKEFYVINPELDESLPFIPEEELELASLDEKINRTVASIMEKQKELPEEQVTVLVGYFMPKIDLQRRMRQLLISGYEEEDKEILERKSRLMKGRLGEIQKKWWRRGMTQTFDERDQAATERQEWAAQHAAQQETYEEVIVELYKGNIKPGIEIIERKIEHLLENVDKIDSKTRLFTDKLIQFLKTVNPEKGTELQTRLNALDSLPVAKLDNDKAIGLAPLQNKVTDDGIGEPDVTDISQHNLDGDPLRESNRDWEKEQSIKRDESVYWGDATALQANTHADSHSLWRAQRKPTSIEPSTEPAPSENPPTTEELPLEPYHSRIIIPQADKVQDAIEKHYGIDQKVIVFKPLSEITEVPTLTVGYRGSWELKVGIQPGLDMAPSSFDTLEYNLQRFVDRDLTISRRGTIYRLENNGRKTIVGELRMKNGLNKYAFIYQSNGSAHDGGKFMSEFVKGTHVLDLYLQELTEASRKKMPDKLMLDIKV